jgi:hypothetical protein
MLCNCIGYGAVMRGPAILNHKNVKLPPSCCSMLRTQWNARDFSSSLRAIHMVQRRPLASQSMATPLPSTAGRKNTFHVIGLDDKGAIILRHKL